MSRATLVPMASAQAREEMRVSFNEMFSLLVELEQEGEGAEFFEQSVRENVRNAVAERLNSYQRFFHYMKAQILDIEGQIERLQRRKLAEQNTEKKLRNMIARNMEAAGIKTLKTNEVIFSLNPGKTSLHIFDEGSISEEFQQIETVVSVNKTKLTAALKVWQEGDPEIQGAQLLTGDSFITVKER